MKQLNFAVLLAIIAVFIAISGSPVHSASPPIGINGGFIDDYGVDITFADAMKQCRFWVDAATGTNYNIGDSNGWPTMDARCGLIYGGNDAGTYALSFNGSAASIATNNGGISNQVYNSSTNTTTATLTVSSSGTLELTFTGTKRTSSSGTNTGITNVKLMRPSTEGGSTPLATSVTFTPAYETLLSQFSVVRFMDMEATNFNYSVNWSDRITPSWFSQSSSQTTFPGVSKGCAWEYCVQLCNEINKDMWINVPRFASNDYITKLSQLIKYGSDGTNPYTTPQSSPVWKPLNSGLHVYVEYSNENWNFAQSDLWATGNQEMFGYPVSTNGLAAAVSNGSLSSIADFDNGLQAPAGEIPGIASTANPNYFRDVVFNNSTTVMTNQTPAATASDASGGDELGMKFKSTSAGTITGVRFYKASGETGTHTGHLWKYGAPDGNQSGFIWSTGTLSQTMTFPATGSYTISYYASAVTNDQSAPTIQVSVDGSNVGSAITPTFGFQHVTSASFNIGSAGAHTVMFSNTSSTGRALIDLITVSGAGSVTVANNSFESPVITSAVPNVTQSASSYVLSAASGWTAGGSGAGYTLCGTSGAWGDFNCYGTLLGSVTFSGETGSGWQQANFGTGVSIAANTTYEVSVNNNSTYAYTNSSQIGPMSWDGNMTLAYYRRWVERAVQASSIFRSVWGDSAMTGTSSNPIIRPVLMMVASGGWIGNYTYNDLEYFEDYFNNQPALTAMPDGAITTAHPIGYYFWSGGGAPYYDPSGTYDINSAWTTGDWNLTNFTNDWLTGTANVYGPEWGKYISYEGGPELPDSGSLSTSLWNDSRMTSLLTSHQTAYNQDGGDLWCYFDTSSGINWGFVQDDYVTNTPKMIGVSQIDASTEATSTYGTAIPGTIPATSTVGTNWMSGFGGQNFNNMIPGVNHSSFVGYTVSVASAAAFTIGVSAGSVGTANQANVYVDGALVGTITMANTGSNTTYANSSTVTGPSLGVGTHGIMIKAVSGSFGLNAVLVTGGTVTVPNPPAGLTATATTNQVTLGWSASSGATGYNVYRGTTAGGESGTPIATGLIVTNYTNTGLTNGTTYYYKVAAANSAGTSGMSNEASATPVDNTGHIIQTSTAPTIDGTVDSVWSSATAYSAAKLFNGPIPSGQTFSGAWKAMWDSSKLYLLFQITNNKPLVSNSTSPWQGDDVEVYVDSTDSKTTSYGNTDFQYELGYNLSAAQETKHGATSGVQYASTAVSGGWVAEASIPWTTLGVTPAANNLVGFDVDIVDGFNTGSTKLFWWDADNTDWTNPSSFGTGLLQGSGGSAPSAPTGLTATAGNTQVALSWSASSGATSYNVYRGTTAGGESGTAIATGISSTAYTNTGLTNGTTYFYKVAAVNSIGTSGMSNEASATPATGVPAAPTGLTATAGNSQVGLSWSASSGATSYNVYRGTTSGGESGTAIATGIATTSYTNTGLTNGTTYFYKVAAVNASGTSGMSNEASATPTSGGGGVTVPNNSFEAPSVGSATYQYNPTGATWTFAGESGIASNGSPFGNPNAPDGTQVALLQGFTGQTLGSVSVPVSFSATGSYTLSFQAAQRGGQVQPIKVTVDGTQVGSNISPTSTTFASYTTASFTISTTGNHTISLGATDSSGDKTTFIDLVTIASAGGSAPPAPTGLTATSGNTQVALSWSASTGATSYNVYRGTAAGGESGTAIATGIAVTNYTNTGLTNGTTYFYKVAAVNASGTSGMSNEASATPQVAVPPAPTGLTATPGNAQVALSWSASTGATSYNVYRGTTAGGESGTAIVTGLSTTSYTNTGLTNGTTYFYKVAAVNASGTSGMSNEASATPAAATVTVPNNSFEAPALTAGTYQFTPTGATWTFAGDGGIASNGSGYGNPNAPDGVQVAFLQGFTGQTLGSMTVPVSFSATGSYTISFQAAERGTNVQPIKVTVDGTQVGSNITPTSSAFANYTSASFTISTTGNHTIGLTATTNTSDNTAFVDLVTIH